jgi:hypothetical protein
MSACDSDNCNFRTPHTEKLHVVERWKMADGGQALDVSFTVEDPDAFNAPWSGTRRFRRVQNAMAEDVCAPSLRLSHPGGEQTGFLIGHDIQQTSDNIGVF